MILALIDETEHLLFDDVREISDRTLEQLRLFDHRNAELLVPVSRENLPRDALQVLPGRDLRGQHIVYAAQGLDDLAQEPLDQPVGRVLRDCMPEPAAAAGLAALCESRLRTPSAPASKRATSPATNCGPIATARLLISSCTPLANPRYTRMGAMPAMVLTLLARPLPANARRPAASCTSTQESAEKLKRRRARPVPAVEVASAAGEAAAAAAPDGVVDGASDGDGGEEFADVAATGAVDVGVGTAGACAGAVPEFIAAGGLAIRVVAR